MGAIVSADSTFYRDARTKQYVQDRDPAHPRAYVGKDGHIYCDFDNKRCHYTPERAEEARLMLPNHDRVETYRHRCGYYHNGHKPHRDGIVSRSPS